MAREAEQIEQQKPAPLLARPFFPPPMCAVTPNTNPGNGEPLVVLWRDGTRSNGKLHCNEIPSNLLLMDVEGNKKPVHIDLSLTKLVYLPTVRKWVNLPQSPEDNFQIVAQGLLDFQVTFKDGDELKGKTAGFYTDKLGLYLYPSYKEGFFHFSVIPHDLISDYQIGPKIGEQLIEDKVISPEHIASALLEQIDKRSKPLGEYIAGNALVTLKELEQALNSQKTTPNIKLGDLLIQDKLITEEQLEDALNDQLQDRSTPLGEILIKQGKLTLDQIQHALARKLGIPYVDLDKIAIDEQVLKLIPEKFAKQYNVLPLHIYDSKIVVVMNNPLDWKTLDEIRFILNMQVIPVMAPETKIKQVIVASYYALEEQTAFLDDARIEEIVNEEESLDEPSVSDNVVVRLANKIVIDAHQKGASDIHIEPYFGQEKTIVRFRKDGSLINYHKVPGNFRRALVARYKVMAGLDVSERRIPQDGKINFGRYSRLKVELRLATIPTAGAEEDVVIRILAGGAPVKIEELLLSKDNLECTKYVLKNPHGLFFVCGPTGSGKTTTLHSVLSHLNTPDRKIWTVEDPVEIIQKGIRQVQIQPKAGLTFATALRSFLRADPDIIMVGEMRDKETTEIGIEASLTGHLVLSTLHTNSAVESVIRLLEMGMDPYNFSDALLGVLAQRLTKKLCNDCKQAYNINEMDLKNLAKEYCHEYESNGLDQGKHRPEAFLNAWRDAYTNGDGEIILYMAKSDGCPSCEGTGYKGRIGLHEMLMASNDIRVAIYRQASVSEMLKLALVEGMKTLKQDGIAKVFQGYTDMRQVRKVCPN